MNFDIMHIYTTPFWGVADEFIWTKLTLFCDVFHKFTRYHTRRTGRFGQQIRDYTDFFTRKNDFDPIETQHT